MDVQQGEEQGVSPQEREDVKRILGQIERGRKFDRDAREEWRRWRHYASTGRAPGTEPWLIDTNLIEATIEGLLPLMYARNPEIGAKPAESVRPSMMQEARDFARTSEVLLTRLLEDAELKRKIKRLCRATMTTGIGWLKLGLHGYGRDRMAPQGRPEDAQDQQAFVQRIQSELADDACSYEDRQRLEAELAKAMQALAEKPEAEVMRGAALDVVSCFDIQLPAELESSADYLHSPWIAHGLWWTREQAAEATGLTAQDLKGATAYVSRLDKGDTEADEARERKDSEQCWLRAWEVWDRRSRTVCVVIEGLQRYAIPPSAPFPSTRRFFQFFRQSFHDADGERWPKSDVEMWSKLQDEYCRTRSQWADHRRRSRPARVGAAGTITPEDARKLSDPDVNELVMVNVPPGVDARTAVGQLDPARLDPALYETASVRQDLDQVSGLQDAARGVVANPKTATEAEIMQSGMMTRVGERQDSLEDLISEMARALLEMCLHAMPREDVVRYAGPSAIWPKLEIGDIHQLLKLSVRAGSSGRKSRTEDQQSWSVLLPILTNSVTEIFTLRAQNLVALADSKMELIRETLRRTDDRIDIETIMPWASALTAGGAVAPAMPGLPMAPEANPMPPALPGGEPLPAAPAFPQ
jgi:hypothetical protein